MLNKLPGSMQYLFVVKDIVVIYRKKKLFYFNPFETLFSHPENPFYLAYGRGYLGIPEYL